MARFSELERGKDLSRIEAFSDGVFAIAITLLVLQIDVPTEVTSSSSLWQGIGDELGDFIAYGISFAVIGNYWLVHHRFMRTIQEFDTRMMRLNFVFLALVVLVPFTSEVLGEYGKYPLSMVLYAINLTVISLTYWLILLHVSRAGLLKPEFFEDARLTQRSNLFNAVVFAASAPLALLLGPWTPVLWVVMALDPYQRRRDRLAARFEREERDG